MNARLNRPLWLGLAAGLLSLFVLSVPPAFGQGAGDGKIYIDTRADLTIEYYAEDPSDVTPLPASTSNYRFGFEGEKQVANCREIADSDTASDRHTKYVEYITGLNGLMYDDKPASAVILNCNGVIMQPFDVRSDAIVLSPETPPAPDPDP